MMDQLINRLKLQSWVDIWKVLALKVLEILYLLDLKLIIMVMKMDFLQQSIMVIHNISNFILGTCFHMTFCNWNCRGKNMRSFKGKKPHLQKNLRILEEKSLAPEIFFALPPNLKILPPSLTFMELHHRTTYLFAGNTSITI